MNVHIRLRCKNPSMNIASARVVFLESKPYQMNLLGTNCIIAEYQVFSLIFKKILPREVTISERIYIFETIEFYMAVTYDCKYWYVI